MPKKIIVLLLSVIMFSSCISEDKNNFSTEDDINLFIWRGLNAFYLWQNDVSVLSDNFFNDEEEIYDFFRENNSPENTFNNLLFKPGNIDRFSVIVDDYIALENSFQGISVSNGMEFQLFNYNDNPNNLYAVVEYIIPNTSASSSGVKRGMVFNRVNNTQLTTTNSQRLLFSEFATNYTIGLANFNNGNPINIDKSISLTKTTITENPILIEKVFTEETKQIGYLMYNQFNRSFDDELNTTFGNFKAENINDLILDLRYNHGGSVQTAIYLGSMVTGQFSGEVFSKQRWNTKVLNSFNEENFTNNFAETIIQSRQPINSLNLSKLYVIVSSNTASASELIINALSAYIDVEIIGDTTVGKQVGSITLYDSDNLQRDGDNLNDKHNYALQPIVLEIVNKNNENDSNGYTPGIDIPGIFLKEDYSNLGVLGEKSDPLLRSTLNLITNNRREILNQKKTSQKKFYNSKLAKPMSNNMYLDF